MSAIVGIFNRDGRPLERTALDRMVTSLAHRGRDGSGVWCADNVGLGHLMLWTTPESLHEQLPAMHGADEPVITADARIDNREELAEQLGLTAGRLADLTDSDLILAAYDHWGAACPEKLLGDFAFAIWDRRKQMLFCARDHLGIKPFYYYMTDQTFVFATEHKAILMLPEVPRRINEVKIANHLALLFDDKTDTFYKGVHRLPPAHILTVTPRVAHCDCYWSLNPTLELRLGSDEEYAARFREILTEAVRCRMRSSLPVGAYLSGGLDSSSVACLARDLRVAAGGPPLPTFSWVFDRSPDCDERPYINAVLARQGFDPHFLPDGPEHLFTDLDQLLQYQGEPYFGPGLLTNNELYALVAQHNIRVVLDGHGGDEIVSKGEGYLLELALAGRWLRLAIELHFLTRRQNRAFVPLLWAWLDRYAVKPQMQRVWPLRVARKLAGAVRRRLTSPRPLRPGSRQWQSIVSPELAERTEVAERYSAYEDGQPQRAASERERHYRDITNSLQPAALEVLDRATAAFAFEQRYPLLDRRVVEFCLSLPAGLKLRHAWDRYILRRGLADVLPVAVQWRVGKTDFYPDLLRRLLALDPQQLRELSSRNADTLRGYANAQAVIEAGDRVAALQSAVPREDFFTMVAVEVLARWLRTEPAASADATVDVSTGAAALDT